MTDASQRCQQINSPVLATESIAHQHSAISSSELGDIASRLRSTLGILHKRDIQTAAAKLDAWVPQGITQEPIVLGDDCAAIPDDSGYLLLAAEGLWPTLVEAEPWFAGWCAVLVNVSDVYAMGGQPIAVVDALWSQSGDRAHLIWDGMTAASRAFNVPIVGGHSNYHSPYNALSVAILGRAQRLLTSFNAQAGDLLVLVADLDGQAHPDFPFWDAATMKEPSLLQANLKLLPQVSEARLCDTAKDISMGGIVGTTLMLLETSGCGAVLDLSMIPYPPSLSLEQWLVCFPSYGFLLSLRPETLPSIQPLFHQQQLICEPIGQITWDSTLVLQHGHSSIQFWDLKSSPLTGFSSQHSSVANTTQTIRPVK